MTRNDLDNFDRLKLKGIIFSKNLTFRSKCILIFRRLKSFVLDIDVFNLTGVFVFFILLFYMDWFKALVIGIFGYLIYLRLEETMLRIKKR